MKTKFYLKNLEIGQVIPIVVITFAALIMMAALMIDGGMLLSNRRTAQAAADAGALAGARTLCLNDYNKDLAKIDAGNYVVDNDAELLKEPSFPQDNTIHVETRVSSGGFFAGIFEWFNQEEGLTATAEAEASCEILGSATERVLPVIFPCIPDGYFGEEDDYFSIGDEGDSLQCVSKYYDGFSFPTDEEYSDLILGGYITIIMDTESDQSYCKPDGPFTCDVDGDGRNDIVAAGSRGWLSLDGTNNKNDLKDWINNGFDGVVKVGYWLSTITGVDNSIFDTIKGIEGDEVIVPFFNAFCRLGKPSEKCNSLPDLTLPWREGDYDDDIREGTGHTDYRITGFGKFVVTCVHSTGQDKDGKGSRCGFRNWLIESDDYPDIDNSPSLKSIEGYFIEAVEQIGESGGSEGGTYIIKLTK